MHGHSISEFFSVHPHLHKLKELIKDPTKTKTLLTSSPVGIHEIYANPNINGSRNEQ